MAGAIQSSGTVGQPLAHGPLTNGPFANSGGFWTGVGPGVTVTLGSLTAIYDGTVKSATVATMPPGLSVSVTYNGLSAAPTNAGSYSVVATATAPGGGMATVRGTLLVAPAPAMVTLSSLTQVFDGDAKFVVVTTVPTGLSTAITYNGASAAPTNPGYYSVVAVVTNPNYQGAATNQLTIQARAPLITSGPTNQIVPVGQTANLSVGVLTAGTVGYQWLKDGILLPGATNATLTIGAMAFTNCGSYRVVVSNQFGMALGMPAGLSTPAAPLRGWGVNGHGELGDGFTQTTLAAQIVGTNVVTMAGGTNHSLWAGTDGVLWATGDNTYGQLGLGTMTSTATPMPVASNVVAVAAGFQHSLFVTGDGVLWAMGNNAYGQLGTGGTNSTAVPVPMASNVVAAAAGLSHSIFLDGQGRVWGTGDNWAGQVGNGTTNTVYSPVMVASNTVAVSAGRYISMGLAAGGAAWGTGNNSFGQFGNGGFGGYLRPQTVASNLLGVATGQQHALYLRNDHTLIVAGDNQFGQLGNNSSNKSVVFLAVASNVVAMTGGRQQSLFIRGDGRLWGMGNNSFGALGTGVTTPALVPTILGGGTWSAATLAREPDADFTLVNAETLTVAVSVTNVTFVAGQTAALNAVVTGGDAPFTYQWDFNGNAIPGATGSQLLLPGVTVGQAGNYGVTVTGLAATSRGVGTLTVLAQPWPLTVTLSNLIQPFNGRARTVTVTESPAGVPVAVTYNGGTQAPVNAGTYQVVVNSIHPLYNGGATNNLVITPIPAVVVLTPASLRPTYDGTAKAATATTSPTNLSLVFTYSGSAVPPTNAGSYTVVAQVTTPNYAGMATNTLVIAPVTTTVTLGNLAQVYDGTGKAVAYSTAPAGGTVALTYNGAATTPTNAGSYAVVGTLSDSNHTGRAVSGTLVIAKAAGSLQLGNLTQVYTGTTNPATAVTVPTGLGVTFTYNGSATVPVNAGSYTVVGTLQNGNYYGAATNTLVISPATPTITLGNLNPTYTGRGLAATAATVPAGLAVALTYNGATSAPTNAGSYQVVGKVATANYAGSITNTFVIAPAAATVKLTGLTPTYTGQPLSATAATVPVGLAVALTYNGSSNPPLGAGSYAVAATITNPNYAGGTNGTLVVAKAPGTVVLGGLAQTYDGTARTISAATVPPGLGVTLTYHGVLSAPTNAGSYAVAGTIADANYTGLATGTLVVGKGLATVTLGNLSPTYSGLATSAAVTTTPAGLGVTLTYNGGTAVPVNAGTYRVVGLVADSNFSGGATNSMVLSPATVQLTLTNLTQVYNGRTHPVSVLTSPAGVAVTVTYNGATASPVNAGSYSVNALPTSANYSGSATGTLVISPAAAAVTISGTNLVQTYDGTAKAPTVTTVPAGLPINFSYTVQVLGTNDTPVTVAGTGAPTNAGRYTLTATVAANNYTGSATTNRFFISPAPVALTLGNLTQTQDGTAKTVTVTENPSGIPYEVIYEFLTSSNVFVLFPGGPTNAASYTVSARTTNANYSGLVFGTLVINPPLQGNLGRYRLAGGGTNNSAATPVVVLCSETDLMTNLTAWCGGPMTWGTAAGRSANGGAVTVSKGVLRYQAPAGFAGMDAVTYTATGACGTVTGLAWISVGAGALPALNYVELVNGQVSRTLVFHGRGGGNYLVQGAESPAGPWTVLAGPLAAPTGGLVQFEDTTQPVPAARFYRLVQVP